MTCWVDCTTVVPEVSRLLLCAQVSMYRVVQKGVDGQLQTGVEKSDYTVHCQLAGDRSHALHTSLGTNQQLCWMLSLAAPAHLSRWDFMQYQSTS